MRISLFVAGIMTAVVLNVSAQVNRAKQFNLEAGVALQGYDPVAYFTEHKAVKGKSEFSATVEGVRYFFASRTNKDLFLKDFKRYEPQYGGWCAYAMGKTGEKVEIDPETFKVLNGKLYLFYNKVFNNTLPKWEADEQGLKTKADLRWARIAKE